MLALISPLFLTYPYVPGKDRMTNNQASYFVSTRLILYSLESVHLHVKQFEISSLSP